MNRAIRRHHEKRMKAKAKYLSMVIWGNDDNVMEKQYNHLANCSCWGCGNPRKWFGTKTRKELME